MDLIHRVLNEEDYWKIANIPVNIGDGKDRMVWPYSASGDYTVKTGYTLVEEIRGKEDQWHS